MSFQTRQVGKYLFIIGQGDQVSNDYYLYCRLQYDVLYDGRAQLLSGQKFYFDVLGVAGRYDVGF